MHFATRIIHPYLSFSPESEGLSQKFCPMHTLFCLRTAVFSYVMRLSSIFPDVFLGHCNLHRGRHSIGNISYTEQSFLVWEACLNWGRAPGTVIKIRKFSVAKQLPGSIQVHRELVTNQLKTAVLHWASWVAQCVLKAGSLPCLESLVS